jgi:hypothetical protein
MQPTLSNVNRVDQAETTEAENRKPHGVRDIPELPCLSDSITVVFV